MMSILRSNVAFVCSAVRRSRETGQRRQKVDGGSYAAEYRRDDQPWHYLL